MTYAGGENMVMGILLAIWGIALLAFGFQANALDRLGEAVVRDSGEEALIYLVAGALAFIIGLFLIFKPDKSRVRIAKK